MNKRITGVGFAGYMCSGKDTAAGYLIDDIIKNDNTNRIITRLALAEPIKQFAIEYLGLNEHQVYDQDGKREYNDFWGMTNREILQKVGTDAMRNGFHPDVWVKITELKIQEAIKNNAFWIITDVRFPNECKMIRQCGGIIVWIVRPSSVPTTPQNLTHISEQTLDASLIDYVLRNDYDLDFLRQNVQKLRCFIEENNSHNE